MSNVSTSKPASTSSNDKPTSSASAKAPAAASNGSPATAPEAKTSTAEINSPLTPVSAGPAPSAESASEDDEKGKIQYHVIVGKVETFPDVSKAEAFLNSPEAPQCTVIYGKTSLVNEWHITTGVIHSFASLVKAQKFLKEPTAPKEFVMIRGRVTAPEVRVSLRR